MSHVGSVQRNLFLDWVEEFGTPGRVKNLRVLAETLRDRANSSIRATEPFCKSRGLIPPANEEPLLTLSALASIARDRCNDALDACKMGTDAEAVAAVLFAMRACRPLELLPVYLKGMAAERSRKARQAAKGGNQRSRCKWDVSGLCAAFEAERLDCNPKWPTNERFVMEAQRPGKWKNLPGPRELLKRCTEWQRAHHIRHTGPEEISATDYQWLLTHHC